MPNKPNKHLIIKVSVDGVLYDEYLKLELLRRMCKSDGLPFEETKQMKKTRSLFALLRSLYRMELS